MSKIDDNDSVGSINDVITAENHNGPVGTLQDLNENTIMYINREKDLTVEITSKAETRLTCYAAGGNQDSEVTTKLFHLRRKGKTHWIHTVPDVPCQVNDEDVVDNQLLNQGALIKAPGRLFRYQCCWPKDCRNHTLNLEDLSEYMNSLDVDLDMPSLDSSEWCIIKIPSLADELKESLNTPSQISHLAASYLSHQLVLHTDTSFTAIDLDDIFKAIDHVVTLDSEMLMTFIIDYNKGQCQYHKDVQELQEGTPSQRFIPYYRYDPSVPGCLHQPIIELLTNSLRVSLEPAEYTKILLKCLGALSHFTCNLEVLIKHQVTPVILGVLAVYSQDVDIQVEGLNILSRLAAYTPLPGIKCPVRESAVELTVMSLKNHPYDVRIILKAFTVLLTLVQTYSTLIDNLSTCGPMMPAVQECVRRSSSLLDFIRQNALPVTKEICRRHTDNQEIQNIYRTIAKCIQSKSNIKRGNTLDRNSAAIKRRLGIPSDYSIPNQLIAENDERKKKISAHNQFNLNISRTDKNDNENNEQLYSTIEYNETNRISANSSSDGHYETINTTNKTSMHHKPKNKNQRKKWNFTKHFTKSTSRNNSLGLAVSSIDPIYSTVCYDSTTEENGNLEDGVEPQTDDHKEAGNLLVGANRDIIEPPELPPRLYESIEPLMASGNLDGNNDSNESFEIVNRPSGIDPAMSISSPVDHDMVVSGQMNFISDVSDMDVDTEDFDDTMCDIYEGHIEVMEDLKRKYEIIEDMSQRWQDNQFDALQVLSDSTSKLDISVTVTLLQTCLKGAESIEVIMRGIQVASGLLEKQMHALVTDTLCTCIADVLDGALKEEITGGWGFFTLRKLHVLTSSIVSNPDCTITSGLDELHRLLEKLVIIKS